MVNLCDTIVRRPFPRLSFLIALSSRSREVRSFPTLFPSKIMAKASVGHAHERRLPPPIPHPRVRTFQQRSQRSIWQRLSTENFRPIEVIGTARKKRTWSTPRFNCTGNHRHCFLPPLRPSRSPDRFADFPPSLHVCGVQVQFQQILQFHKDNMSCREQGVCTSSSTPTCNHLRNTRSAIPSTLTGCPTFRRRTRDGHRPVTRAESNAPHVPDF